GSFEAIVERLFGPGLRERAAEPRSDGAVVVADAVARRRGRPLGGDPFPELAARGDRLLRANVTERLTVQGREKAVELQRAGTAVGLTPLQQIGAADRLVEAPQSDCRELTPHFFGNQEKVVLDHLRSRRELRAQLRTLGRDPDGAAVDVTRS